MPKHGLLVSVVAWVQDKVTHDLEVRLDRAQHLSQSSIPATSRSLHQAPSPWNPLQKPAVQRVFFASLGEELRTVARAKNCALKRADTCLQMPYRVKHIHKRDL